MMQQQQQQQAFAGTFMYSIICAVMGLLIVLLQALQLAWWLHKHTSISYMSFFPPLTILCFVGQEKVFGAPEDQLKTFL